MRMLRLFIKIQRVMVQLQQKRISSNCDDRSLYHEHLAALYVTGLL